MTRILIIGAGAVGATLAWHLSSTPAHVALLARGARKAAIEDKGLTLWRAGRPLGTRAIPLLSRPEGDWDAVLLCVKQYDLPALLPSLPSGSPLVPMVNGMPWWLLRSHPLLRGRRDWGEFYDGFPAMPAERLMGAVVYFPAQMRDACNVEQGGRDSLALGEIEGGPSARLHKLAAAINASGLQCRTSGHIQADIWNKLLGNAAFNPISALALATMHQMLTEPGLRRLCARLIGELMAVGQALGYQESQGVEGRLRQAESAGHARTSMLQDALAGRPLEGEALIGVLTRMAAHLGIPAPTLDSVWALLNSRFSPTGDRPSGG